LWGDTVHYDNVNRLDPVLNVPEVVVHYDTKRSRANVTCKMLNLTSRENMQAGTKTVINPHEVMGNLGMTSLSQQQKALATLRRIPASVKRRHP